MKKRNLFFILLAALIAPLAMFGQGTTTMTVYDGTVTNNHVPAYIFYFDDFTRSQFVIPADDLEALGDGAVISAVSFYATSAYPASGKVQAPVDVYLKEVSYTSISAFEATASATIVYSGTLETGEGNVMTITFTTPYTYHNGNLLIGIENTESADYQGVYFNGQTVTGASVSGSNGSSLSGVTANQQNFIPKTTFTYIPGTISGCVKPTLGEAEYITEEGASFQWTEIGTATTWELQYSTSNDFSNPTTITRNGIPAYAITGLESGTTYYVRLRSYCGDSEYSSWSNTVSFRTLCSTYGLPHFYGFEDAGELDCWNVYGATSTSTGIVSASDAPEGSNVFRFHYSERSAFLMSPVFTGTTNGLSVTFQYMNSSTTTGYTEEFQVGYTTDANESDPSNFTYGETIYGENEWVLYEDVFPANTKRIAIKYIYTDGYYLRLDDFAFEVPSDCRKPTDLAISNLAATSATLSWTENGAATAWDVEITDLDGGQVTTWNATSTTYPIVGLTEYTHYSVRVNPVCDVDKWSDPITFTTPELCPRPTNLTVRDIEPMGATIVWEGEASSYTMAIQEPLFFYGFEEAEPWDTLNFPPCTTYDGDGAKTYGSGDFDFPNENYYGACIAMQNGVYDDYNSSISAYSGNAFGAMWDAIPSSIVNGTTTDDWFILPELTIENGMVFSFMAREIFTNWGPEIINVGVYGSTDGTFESVIAENVEIGTTEWLPYTYDLSAYAGQTIRLAINCVSDDVLAFFFDDLFVGYNYPTTEAVVINDVTSPYELELDPETTYQVFVQSACGGDNGNSAWVYTMFSTPSNCATPYNLNSTDVAVMSATLNWEGYQDSYQIQYRVAAHNEASAGSFFEDFESGSLETNGWTVLREGEGTEYTDWRIYDGNFTGGRIYPHSGEYLVMGRSWSSDAYAVDNWLISPQVTLDGQLSYWVLDDGEYHEHYDVYVSTTTNDVSAFTLLYEPGDATDEWTEHTVDLTSYAGAQGYIAFRQVDEDKDFLFIDDVTIGSVTEVPAGDWITVTSNTNSVNLTGLASETPYEWQVRGVNENCDGGYTEWSEIDNFTTLSGCLAPTALAVIDTTGNSATLSWTGNEGQESFNIRYRTSIDAETLFEDDLTGYEVIDEEEGLYGIGDWTTVNLQEGGGNFGGQFVFYYTENPPQYLISPELDGIVDGSTLQFYVACYSEDFTETFKVGFSTTGNDVDNDFTWGEEVSTEGLTAQTFYRYTTSVPEGAKYFAIQCTSDDQLALFVADFWIYGPITPAGEWVEIDGVTSPYTITGLNPETWYDWQLQVDGCDTWYDGPYFQTLEETNITQTIQLTAGFNWISVAVDVTLDQLKAALVEALPGSTQIRIYSSAASTTYNGSRWRGQLTEMNVTEMYMVESQMNGEIVLEGMPIDLAANPIVMHSGINWIAYPLNQSMTVTNAFASFAVSGDKIYSQESSSTFNGSRWRGSVTNLEPGKGYQYESENDRDPFVFPTAKAAKKHALSSENLNIKPVMMNKTVKSNNSNGNVTTKKVTNNPNVKSINK